ncbi:hypothetical protein B0T22DRAFT_177095 [Podospora appendiculata]|uniref:Uncharacterized protein n=1 Tax=Podospora appendiculata TaxID=314037 RepID=A0AAE0XBK2_9PEZI|nr:hypothetical protein B0T22DRAFT_177095 [Podospora appendiculata]
MYVQCMYSRVKPKGKMGGVAMLYCPSGCRITGSVPFFFSLDSCVSVLVDSQVACLLAKTWCMPSSWALRHSCCPGADAASETIHRAPTQPVAREQRKKKPPRLRLDASDPDHLGLRWACVGLPGTRSPVGMRPSCWLVGRPALALADELLDQGSQPPAMTAPTAWPDSRWPMQSLPYRTKDTADLGKGQLWVVNQAVGSRHGPNEVGQIQIQRLVITPRGVYDNCTL